jgi:lipoprotein-anchoring transpeptidase ErfK/SrfK
VRRYASWFLALATLAPAAVVLTAVSMVPSSAYALPVFEFSSAKGPIRISAEDLGAERTEEGIAVDPERFDLALARLQKAFAKPPTPGTYELKPDHRVFLKGGAAGYELDEKATRDMLLRALRGSRSNLRLPVREIPSSKAPSNAVVVVLKEFRLDLYQGPKLTQHFPVGVGALRFPTPPGAYYVRSKAINPTWRNPGSPWSRGMPSYIGPGPNNPLGTRALRLDRGALVIHGTPQPWSIGTRASHGCIRMKRPDIEKLFELVPEQTPVFIVP